VPLTRPAEISDGVSLSDKLTRQDLSFVSVQAALDAFLVRDGLVEMLSPNKGSVSGVGAEDDVLSWPDTLPLPLSSWALGAAVVAQIEREDSPVSVLCDVLIRCNGLCLLIRPGVFATKVHSECKRLAAVFCRTVWPNDDRVTFRAPQRRRLHRGDPLSLLCDPNFQATAHAVQYLARVRPKLHHGDGGRLAYKA